MIAGEASGDLHASQVMAALRRRILGSAYAADDAARAIIDLASKPHKQKSEY